MSFLYNKFNILKNNANKDIEFEDLLPSIDSTDDITIKTNHANGKIISHRIGMTKLPLSTHIMKQRINKNDTLQSIALRNGCTVGDLKILNGITNDIEFHSIQEILIPNNIDSNYVRFHHSDNNNQWPGLNVNHVDHNNTHASTSNMNNDSKKYLLSINGEHDIETNDDNRVKSSKPVLICGIRCSLKILLVFIFIVFFIFPIIYYVFLVEFKH